MSYDIISPVAMNGPIAAATLTMTETPSKIRFSREKDDQIILPLAEDLKQ